MRDEATVSYRVLREKLRRASLFFFARQQLDPAG
jgi:hypothetical protein